MTYDDIDIEWPNHKFKWNHSCEVLKYLYFFVPNDSLNNGILSVLFTKLKLFIGKANKKKYW
jgi:hypothetical protein